jgi:hypothetical protein
MRGTLDGTLVVVLKQGAHSEIAAYLNSGSPRHGSPHARYYLKSQCRKPANLTFAIVDEFLWFFVAMFALRSSLIAFP